MERMVDSIDALDQFSDEQDDFAAAILADARQLMFDSEGRVMLPDDLRSHANIADAVAFVGMGRIFEMWEPGAFQLFQQEARQRVQSQNRTLANRGPGPRQP